MKQPKPIKPTDKFLPRLTQAFFNRPRLTALLWIALTVFGILSYTTFLKREGFPSIAIPVVVVSGTYAVNDPAAVDAKLAGPIDAIALRQKGASSVTSQSQANFFTTTIQYDESVTASSAKTELQKAVASAVSLPDGASLTYGAPYFGVTGGGLEQVDAAVAVTSDDDSLSTTQLAARSQALISYLQQHKPATVKSFSLADPFQQVTNPVTGKELTVQRSFDRYGERRQGSNYFQDSVTINVASAKGADVIKLDDQLRQALAEADKQPAAAGLRTAVSASYAPAIREQISELQRVLLEGLLAVLVIGSIVIAVRASLITVIAMVSVIAIALGIVYLLGYSLNVITLFALILGLSLIVDDTIIMVEAIDSARRQTTDRRVAVREATRKIARAMVAATLTAVLSFTPLLFVGGVLGSFIRAIPVTIISALLTSLAVALVFIPLFARFLLLGKKQLGPKTGQTAVKGLESRVARNITRPMRWARHHRKREFAVGLTAVIVGLLFIIAGVVIFQKVAFNIFPPSKDSNELAVNLTFDPGTTVPAAEAAASRADAVTSRILGANLVSASYYGVANDRSASLAVELIPYGNRVVTSGQLVSQLETSFKDFQGAKIKVSQVDVGPPSSGFTVNIKADNRPQAEAAARDLARFLDDHQLTRASGKTAHLVDASVGNTMVYQRTGKTPIIPVSADFDADDTTTLVGLAQTAVTKEFTAEKLKQYGLKVTDLSFDIGQESQNQDSFKSLLVAFPIVLLAIYLLLILQFRSFLQPLLIFMALPFSLFGISLGLYLTHNSFSFFAALGFFALIGLSIKNTILLTDYANQARKAGQGPVDAAAGALAERFRPLVATSLTAVVSLIPLAVTSPFWQSLAVTLIFGLLSSTLLVIFIFPYLYLGAEYLRLRLKRR